MARQVKVRTVRAKGNVTVAYRRIAKEWYANALQFDIVGTGRTKEDALDELKELIQDYVVEMVSDLGKGLSIAFFNPADPDEWNKARYIEEFEVEFTIKAAAEVPSTFRLSDSSRMRDLASYIRSVDLVPA